MLILELILRRFSLNQFIPYCPLIAAIAIFPLLLFLLISTFLEWYVFFLLWWLPSFTYYSLIIRIRNIAEHAVVPGKSNLDNTRTTLCSLITGYLLVPHNVNYHLQHHLIQMEYRTGKH